MYIEIFDDTDEIAPELINNVDKKHTGNSEGIMLLPQICKEFVTDILTDG